MDLTYTKQDARRNERKIDLVSILGIGRGFCHISKYDFHSTSHEVANGMVADTPSRWSCLRFAECGVAVPDGKGKSGRNTQVVLTTSWSFRRGTACFYLLAQCG